MCKYSLGFSDIHIDYKSTSIMILTLHLRNYAEHIFYSNQAPTLADNSCNSANIKKFTRCMWSTYFNGNAIEVENYVIIEKKNFSLVKWV